MEPISGRRGIERFILYDPGPCKYWALLILNYNIILLYEINSTYS